MKPESVGLSLLPVVGVEQLANAEADRLLTAWGHYLGPCDRPFGRQSFALHIDGRPVSVAVSASTVSSTVRITDDRTLRRQELVELARLCSAPGERWATRVMLRLWREVHAQRWPYWSPLAAVAYSQNDRHDGRIYRFDGWTKVREVRGTTPGAGSYSTSRDSDHPARGPKSLWLWDYAHLTSPGSTGGDQP
ncbi:hypothetical protein [Nocardioides sp. T2.26MG-1]|uniref:hypothetical protein n=1 Tax=Nocardioides sp. T2.26MG-1 TaxID=3041166 RepID=UPI002477B253|nr:hypothetical protein [Nocardioides sp. T2.26MG-1]CAI9417175.1 hypothetical protein HIDPHFAB_02955 [Nocardioides sp. T2.26MG-1]